MQNHSTTHAKGIIAAAAQTHVVLTQTQGSGLDDTIKNLEYPDTCGFNTDK